MPALSSLFPVMLVVGVILGVSLSAFDSRAPTIDRPGTASVVQVRNGKFVRSGPIALARAYNKYGVALPHDLKAAVARIRAEARKRSTGSAETTPEAHDIEFLTPVSIGSPAQVLKLDFDSGSSDFWVFSTETAKNEVQGQVIYDPSKSSTAKNLQGYTWQIAYGDGSSSSGDVYIDTVTMGGLTFASQAVEVAKKVSDSFTSDSANDGLVGLGFSTMNTVQPVAQKTFFDNVMPNLDAPVFTVDLKHGAAGRYNFGFIDSKAYTGGITYVPVNHTRGFWGWTSPGYAIGSGSFKSTSIQGIADTGTTLLLLPSSVVSDYYGQVSGAKYDANNGGYTLPCTGTVPDFLFGVGDNGVKVRVPGRYVQYAPLTDNSATCYGGIQTNTGIGLTIFGDVALKSAFVVFNGGNQTLGWASKSLP